MTHEAVGSISLGLLNANIYSILEMKKARRMQDRDSHHILPIASLLSLAAHPHLDFYFAPKSSGTWRHSPLMLRTHTHKERRLQTRMCTLKSAHTHTRTLDDKFERVAGTARRRQPYHTGTRGPPPAPNISTRLGCVRWLLGSVLDPAASRPASGRPSSLRAALLSCVNVLVISSKSGM